MNYKYTAKDPSEIVKIASEIRERFPTRVDGIILDVEGVIEDLGITILPRPMKAILDGYVAADRSIIVVNDAVLINAPRARFTLSEELAHWFLESEIWGSEDEVKAIAPEDMEPEQYEALEQDAKALGVEMLQPAELYREQFALHKVQLEEKSPNAPEDWIYRNTVELVAGGFQVGYQTAVIRGKELGLISDQQRREYFYPVL